MDRFPFGNVPPCPASFTSAITGDVPESPWGFGCPEALFLLQAAVGVKAFASAPLAVMDFGLICSHPPPRKGLTHGSWSELKSEGSVHCSGTGAASMCFEETLISPSILAGGFSTPYCIWLPSRWGLGRTFGVSEGLAGGWGGGQAPLSEQDLANHILIPRPQVGVAVLGARWPCRDGAQPAHSPSIPQPRCNRTDPQRASRRRPPLLGGEGEFKRLQRSRWRAQPSPIISLYHKLLPPSSRFHVALFSFPGGAVGSPLPGPGAASSPPCRPRRRLQLCWRRGHLCLPASQPGRPPPPPPAAGAISGNSS